MNDGLGQLILSLTSSSKIATMALQVVFWEAFAG